ncbi:hypothetical protein Tco_1503185, partial [Tanacetum coccineum]
RAISGVPSYVKNKDTNISSKYREADGAQSSRVLVPLPEDPYEAIRQAYLDGTDTESEPIEDPVETKTPETARMVVRVPPAMSSGLSASMEEVAAMFESGFCKMFRSSYESSLSSSPSDLPLRKRYWSTSELVEDSKEDDDEEDEDIEESLDSNSVNEDAEDEGPTTEDEDPAIGDESLAAGDEGPDMDDESHGINDESHGLDDESRGLDDEGHNAESDGFGLEEEEDAVPGGQQQQAAPVVRTAVSAPLRLGYGALRRRELALEEDHVYSTFEVGQGSGSAPESERPERVSTSRQTTLTTWTYPEDGMVYIDVPTYPPPTPPVQTPPSPEWTSGSLPIFPSPSIVPSPVSSPMISLTVPSLVAVEVRSMGISFCTELQEKIASRRLVIELLEKVGATSGWLMRLNKDQEDDVLFDTFVNHILAFDLDVCSLDFDPHACTLALVDASDAYALANIHALAFEISEKEGFASLLLPPLSLYSSDK